MAILNIACVNGDSKGKSIKTENFDFTFQEVLRFGWGWFGDWFGIFNSGLNPVLGSGFGVWGSQV